MEWLTLPNAATPDLRFTTPKVWHAGRTRFHIIDSVHVDLGTLCSRAVTSVWRIDTGNYSGPFTLPTYSICQHCLTEYNRQVPPSQDRNTGMHTDKCLCAKCWPLATNEQESASVADYGMAS